MVYCVMFGKKLVFIGCYFNGYFGLITELENICLRIGVVSCNLKIFDK